MQPATMLWRVMDSTPNPLVQIFRKERVCGGHGDDPLQILFFSASLCFSLPTITVIY